MDRSHPEGDRGQIAGHPLGALVLVAVAALVTIAGLALLWPAGETGDRLSEIGVIREVYDARVAAVEVGSCPGAGPDVDVRCQQVRFRLLEGPDRESVVEQSIPISLGSPELEPGDAVVLGRQPGADPAFEYSYLERNRTSVLVWLALVFAVAVVALGRHRGLAALAGLAVTFVVLLQFVLPAVLDGRSPFLVAVVGSSAIAFVALYLAHGFRLMTTVALLGTLGSLALTAGLAALFVGLARFTGITTDEAGLVLIGASQVDLRGLVLGGVVIGALGAIDDMTVTQASAVWELRSANRELDRRSLFRSGLRIGRDHVASTVNTLALAYAGASMPLLLLFVLSRQSLGAVANGEVVAVEIVRTLVGSIGLVASVPLTTWLAARMVPEVPVLSPPRREARRRREEAEEDAFFRDF
jgi:uncharacterized membrane protein